MNESLSIFVDDFGTCSGAHFFNSLEVCIARAETETADVIGEKSAIAAGAFYSELTEGRFEPRHVFCHETEYRRETRQHDYQRWLKSDNLFPSEGFDFEKTVKDYKDIVEFPLKGEVILRRERPKHEVEETMETAIRLALEREDHLNVFNLVQSLDTPHSAYALTYLLEEVPRKALAFVAAVSFPGLGDTASQITQLHQDQMKLRTLTNFVDHYQTLQGRAAKLFVPLYCEPEIWDTKERHPSLYERSQIAAVVLDALTLPYRVDQPYSGYKHYGSLVPHTSPLVCCAISVNGDAIKDVSRVHAHGDVSRYLNGYPGHSYMKPVERRRRETGEKETGDGIVWEEGQTMPVCRFDEPLGLTYSSTYRDGDRRDMYYKSVIGSPVWSETWKDRETGGDGILDEGVRWLERAMTDSNLVPRSDREETAEVMESLHVIIDSLNLQTRNSDDECID